ncbi:MAG: DHA2 family efflux MFS transporter permease subunit [Methanocorpusculum sp.]|nr:DHA2 family efflux MFS transporter permease subunit [Methanocorpusculum sp.]
MENSSVSGKHLALILVSASLAVFMSSLDGTIVNIALPVISDYFDLSTSSVEWVSTIYLLVMAGALLIIGKITDIIGLKKIFITGFVLFTFGSFACGFFPEQLNSFGALLASRVLQGLGGAMMTVIAPAMISKYMSGAKRAKGMTVVTIFAGIGMALGPTLGGYLTEYLSWNWIFFINVPVGIIAVILGFIVLPKDKSEKSSMKGFDVSGAALIFIGLAGILFGVSEGNTQGWTSVPVIVSLILGIVCVVGFIIRELKAKQPVLDLRLFKNKTFLILNIIFIIMFFTFAGANYLLPFYLQYVQGLSTSSSGLILTVMSFGMMIAGVISGFIYAKLIGKIKYIIMVGAILMALGFFFLSKLSPVSGIWVVVSGLALLGFGIGLMLTPLSTLMMGSVPANKQGMVSSLTGLERFGPMTLGIAFFNILFVEAIKFNVKHSGITEKPPADIAAVILSHGFDFCFLIACIVAVAMIVLSIFIKEREIQVEQ